MIRANDDGPRPPDAVPPPDAYPELARELQSARLHTALWRIARWTGAVLLTLVALFFGFVPGIPGFPLFFLALFLIAADYPPARRLGVRLLRKFPRVRRAVPKRWRRTKGPTRKGGGA
ncbi:MAG: hypothetical protein K8T90_20810 [Planctomycetes bacterium]|nr:hypothetical protein [Planctomycetota bacterium]